MIFPLALHFWLLEVTDRLYHNLTQLAGGSDIFSWTRIKHLDKNWGAEGVVGK